MTEFQLTEGHCYTYGFPGCPRSQPSTFLGYVRAGAVTFLVFQEINQNEEVLFINAALLSSIRPDTW